MKRNLLLGFSLLLTSFGYAQFTAIPDDNFEQALIDQGIDTNPVLDDQVLTSAISGLTFLNLTGDNNLNFNENEIGLGVQSLVGIKGFSSLETLWVQGNALTDMDLAGMSSLKDVRAFFNDLTSINIAGLTNLEIIGLNENSITGIAVNTNTSLQQLDIAGNNLVALDIIGLNALTSMNVANNPNLNCILVENAATANAYNTNANFIKNGGTTFNATCPNIYTEIPDRNFELYLINQGFDSEGGIPNGLVLTQDLEAITSLDLSGTNFSGQNISSLEGLDAFTGLTDLNISYNPLSLPNNDLVLTNTELETIIARNCNLDGASFPTILNEVVTLDFSNEDPRNVTIPSVNSFSSINGLGGVPNVTTFRIEWNQLTVLDVLGASQIEELFLGKNFDLAEIRNLNSLLNLNRMEADDNSLGLGAPLGTINLSGNPNLEVLNLDRSKITGIDLSNNTKLRLLSISDVNLSPTINLSANTDLEFLDLERSQITSLSLATNIELERIELDGNSLTELDISQNTKLFNIKIADNNLSTLDISNIDANLTDFNATGNGNLDCIQVSDLANVRNNWEKDPQANYNIDCSATQKIVEVSVLSNQLLDGNNVYTVISANEPMQIGFNLQDENGDELDASALTNYALSITTVAATNQNPAQGGNVNTPGIDFELLTNEPIIVNTVNNGSDGNMTIAMNGDQLFEADEYFFIQVSTNDPNIVLKNAVNGIVEIPVKIVDNEITNVNLELLRNGAEPNQNARLRITSTLENNTGSPMPFNVSLNGGDAVIGEDYEALTINPAIPNGASSVEFDIIIINNDDSPENEESFFANISYAGNLPNNRIVIQNDNQEITITDDGNVSNIPFTVTATISGAMGSDPNFEIEEGQSFQLNFDTGNTGTNGNTYNPNISIRRDGFGSNEDFDIDDLNKTFIISTNNPDGNIVFTARDDGQEEGIEKYIVSISSENTDVYNIAEPTSFEVTIQGSEGSPEYSGDFFTFNITPKGDVSGNEVNNNLQIEEGEILELWVDAQTPNQADGYSFQLEPLFDPKFKDDIEILENPRITVDNSKNPDGIIKIKMKEDMVVDENELIGLIFRPKQYFSYTNLYTFNGDTFRYIPFTVKNVSSSEYYLTWDNKGSLEGGDDEEILIQLKNKNGTPYTAESDLLFEIAFDTSFDNNILTADVGEYPANKTVNIKAGQSTFTLRYPVPIDIVSDEDAEYYRAVISKSESNPLIIELPDPLIIKILDKENKYVIFAQPFTKQSTNKKYFSSQTSYTNASECCPQYTVQEGSNYSVGFEAEKGVPLGPEKPYVINVTYSYNEDGSSNTSAPQAEELKDFKNRDEDNTSDYFAKYPKDPDNTLIIEIFDDNEEIKLGFDPEEVTEKFEMNIVLDEESVKKYELRSVEVKNPAAFYLEEEPVSSSVLAMNLPFSNTDIFITQVVPMSLEILDGAINEENYESDFAKVKIKRPENGTGFFNEVNLIILANSPTTDASEGVDFEPIQKTIIFGNDIEKEILIKALPDNIVDNGEQIKIGLAPGNGYSFDENNIITVTITDEDVGEFKASLDVSEDSKRLFEDITLGPAKGVFEVNLTNDQNKTPDENIKVNFTINPVDGQPEEGIDYRIFDGQGNEKRDITNSTERYVTIKRGEIKGFISIEVVQNDGVVEPPENVKIQLTSGEGYSLDNSEAFISIISKEQDISVLNPAHLRAFVSSATCPGVDQGKISVSNKSPFDFMVNLYDSSNSDLVINSETLIRNSVDPVQLFDNLKAGNYEIRFIINDRPDILPPTFNLTIRANLESTQLLSSVVDSQLKVANLVVSGSKFYQIVSNDNVYSFKFDTPDPQKLQFPIQNGSNSLVISSEASCQGKIETELFLADYKVFPNPTKSTINFIGFTPNSQIKLYLFDTSGKKALSLDAAVGGSGDFEINVDFLPHGNYFGKILSNGKELLKVKLIKN